MHRCIASMVTPLDGVTIDAMHDGGHWRRYRVDIVHEEGDLESDAGRDGNQ